MKNNIGAVEFATILGNLPEDLPIASQMDENSNRSPRDLVVDWFSGDHAAKDLYNKLADPVALIWIAEALGAETTLVAAVADESLNVGAQSRCGFIREYLPWSLIAELAPKKVRKPASKSVAKPAKKPVSRLEPEAVEDDDIFNQARFDPDRQPADDFDVVLFAQLLSKLEPHLPVSDAYEEQYPQKRGRWWHSQRAHMVNWFSGQGSRGSGAYSRENPNLSAKRCYNRLLSDAGILWLNEAMGIDPERVQAAADAAAQEPDHRKRCGIIRKHLPWDDVVALAKEKTHLLKW